MKGLWMGLMAHPQLVDVFFSETHAGSVGFLHVLFFPFFSILSFPNVQKLREKQKKQKKQSCEKNLG